MAKNNKITDRQIKCWARKHGHMDIYYRFDWMSIAARAQTRAWIKMAIKMERSHEKR